MKKIALAVLTVLTLASCRERVEPESKGPVPAEMQLSWQKLEYFMRIEPDYDNYRLLRSFDYECWARLAKEAGMKGIVLAIDGSFSEGDVIRDFDDVCTRYGIRLYTFPTDASLFRERYLPGLSESRWSFFSEGTRLVWRAQNVIVTLDKRDSASVATVDGLFDVYLRSVGNNSSLIVDVPVLKNGRPSSSDSTLLMDFRNRRTAAFHVDYAKMSRCLSADVRAMKPRYAASNIVDGRYDTYWTPDDGVTSSSFTVYFRRKRKISGIQIQEYIPKGQRVESFLVEYREGEEDDWKRLTGGTTIGYKRILMFKTVKAGQVRITVNEAKAAPMINNLAIYGTE